MRARAHPLAGLALVVSSALVPVGLVAQSRIDAKVDTTQATLGDHITLTVTVDHPRGSRVAWPDSLDLTPFEVLAARTSPDVPHGDTLRTTATITVAAFQLGDLELPGFKVPVLGPGDAVDTLATDAFGIRVVSVGADKSGDIRDIRGPLAIPLSIVRVALWILAVLVLLAAGLWVGRRLRRRDGATPPAARPGPPPRPPHEVALEALARLEASPMLERGQVKEYYIEASDILRTYVEGRFGVGAPEMTTGEVLDGLRRAGVEDGFVDGLGDFLGPCDLVKFAKLRPTPEAARATLALGRHLVESTIPAPPPSGVDSGTEADEDAEASEAGEASEVERPGQTREGGETDPASHEAGVA